MIAQDVENKIQTFLRTHRASQRAVAERFGVSRSVVKRLMQQQHLSRGALRRSANVNEDGPFVLPEGMPQRCPGCGHRVQMPCLACQLRGRK